MSNLIRRDEAGALRADIARHRAPSTGKLAPEVRARAVAYAERRIAAGARKCDIARELDVSQTTVAHWLSTAQPPRFEEVAIINDTSRSCGLVVVTPRGLRIEGLDLAAVVELVARHG